jgi:uncharacterized membrane protein YkoI
LAYRIHVESISILQSLFNKEIYMTHLRTGFMTMLLTLTLASGAWAAGNPIDKDQAIEKALNAHPGEVLKAYQETKKGTEVWEVKIKDKTGITWEIYYKVADGELFLEQQDG